MLNRSYYTAMLGLLFCSAAFGIQPSVRAGSVSLNTGIKPVSTTITPITTSAALTAARGSSLPKFSSANTPISVSNSSASKTASALEDLRQQINELKSAQQGLAQNQITRQDVTDVIATTDLPRTNSGLNTTLTEMRTTSDALRTSVDSIQHQTEQFTETLNTDIDNRLQVRGLIDENNQTTYPSDAKVRAIIGNEAAIKGFVTETTLAAKNFADSETIRDLRADIAPAALAASIAGDETAKATLNDAGFAKKAEVNDAIENVAGNIANLVSYDELNTELSGYVKPDDITRAKLAETLGDEYLTNDTLTKTVLTEKLGDEYVKDVELANKLAANNVATTESLATLATQESVNALSGNVDTLSGDIQTLTAKVDGGVNDSGSILNRISTNETIRAALKGDTGAQGEKGDKGDTGASFAFRTSITSTDQLAACTSATQGFAFYNDTDGNMYICGCVNDTCQYATAHIKGETGTTGEQGTRGIDAKPVEQTYCENNINIVSALYPSYSSVESCATFPYNYYNAITTGAKAYCLSLAQNAISLDKDTGIGLRLEQKLGTGIVSNLKNSGLTAKIPGTNQSFITECEARYNEIMSGDDGQDAKSVEQTYCEENFEIVHALYSEVATVADCADTTKFSNAKYSAIMGGAKAYCLSLAQNAISLDLTNGIGKKLVDTFGEQKMTSFKNTSNAVSRINMSGFAVSKETDAQTTTFQNACEARYAEIMAGDKGDTGAAGTDGRDGDTFVPSFNTETGKITWVKDNNTTNVSDFDIGSTIDSRAVVAVKNQINTTNSDIANAINNKITANNASVLTIDNLKNLISSGALKVGCNNTLSIEPSLADTDLSRKLGPTSIKGTAGTMGVCQL